MSPPKLPDPGTPPNPPMFGSQTTGDAGRRMKQAQGGGGFGGTFLGPNTNFTGQGSGPKTLLGQ